MAPLRMILLTTLVFGHWAADVSAIRHRRNGTKVAKASASMGDSGQAILEGGPVERPADTEISPAYDSIHCHGGSGSTDCPRSGDNYLSSGGGGSCKFRYTWHDGMGADTGVPVVTSGSCTITSADRGQGSHTNERVRNWVRSLGEHDGAQQDDAGHILANNLGGCGTCPINLFPQNLRINRGEYRLMEAAIYDCVEPGVTASLSWKFWYSSPALQHLRPSSYQYNATFSGGNCGAMSAVFQNEHWTPSAYDAREPWMQVSG